MNRMFLATCIALVAANVPWRRAAAADPPFVFSDVAAAAGLHEPLRGMMGHAAAWGDVDGDGWIDLFVGTFADRPADEYRAGGADGPVANQLLMNRKGKFQRSNQQALAWLGRASGSVFADFDNDGRLDLYVANNGRLGSDNLLYRNRGDGQFENVTSKAGAPLHTPETARSATVLDFDGDGLLDLLVLSTVGKGKTILFRNCGAMKFEVSDAIPGDATGLGLAVADVTGNGWPDVMIGGPNRLFVNMGDGKFREAAELDLNATFTREDDSPSCGVAFGDFDRDGHVDMLIGSHHKAPWNAQPNAIRLYRNLGSTPTKVRFEDVTAKVGIVDYPMKVPHVEIRDFDNDGWPDLYTAVVTMRDGEVHPAIYKNLGAVQGKLPQFQETAFVHRRDFPGQDDIPDARSGAFYEKLVANGKVMYFAPGPSGDFDNDGRLDLFLPSWFPKLPSMLLRNETPAGGYLDVAVVGAKGVNGMGIGAVVRAYTADRAGEPDALIASEEIATGYGFCSGQPAVAHLGLGEAAICDLVLTLPHGKGRIVRRGVKANQRLEVSE
ncbi:MAG: VCBS repeat-containing protein [Pirellulales bacterium]